MSSHRLLHVAFLGFWTLCALLSSLAFWTQIRLGNIRMADMQEITVAGILRFQAPPWIAIAALTPLVVRWTAVAPPAAGRWRMLTAHAGAATLYILAFAALSLNMALVLQGRPPEWRGDLIASRAAGSLALIVTTYAVTVGATMAFRYHREARERTSDAERLARSQADLERDLAQARLLVLRQHLQPHFLFNALNAVSGLVDADPPAARRVLARLGDLLRLALDRRDAAHATLGEELDFVDRYLAVEQARFGERLRVSYDVPADLFGAELPTFALQPLVENAVRHGIAPLPEGGHVRIAARRREQGLEIRVENDAPRAAPGWREGIGLGGLRDRLTAMYGPAARLRAELDDSGRFIVILTLPGVAGSE